MQRLNIPLSRHTKTTRRNRRVVWLLVLGWFVSAFITYRVGVVWLSRSNILQMAPADTVASIHLQVTEKTAPYLVTWLAGVPLISNRSLSITDLLPYTNGELAIFITNEGERSVAIRPIDEFPDEILSSYEISNQKQGSFVLLSSTLTAISGMTESIRRPLLPTIGSTWLGRIVLPDDHVAGHLYHKTNQFVVEIPTKSSNLSRDRLVVDAPGLMLSHLMWPEETTFPTLDRLLDPFLAESQETSIFLEHSRATHVVIRPTDSGLESLFVLKNAEIEDEQLIHELQILGALAKPLISTSTMEDGTILQELEVHPELVSVEQISTALGTGYRVATQAGSVIVSTIHKGDVLISNSEKLMEDFAQTTSSDIEQTCKTEEQLLIPEFLLSQITVQAHNAGFNFFHEVFLDFSVISLELNKYSSKLHICIR